MKYPFKSPYLNAWSVFFYINALVLLAWVLLKVFRIIQTPLIFELIPAIVGLSAIFGFGAGFGKFIQIILQLSSDVKELKTDSRETRSDLIMLKADFRHYAKYRKEISS